MNNFLSKLESDNYHFYNASDYFHTKGDDYSRVFSPNSLKMIYFGFEIIIHGSCVIDINDPSTWMNGKEDYSNSETRYAKDIFIKLIYFDKHKWMYRLTDDSSCHRYGIVVGGFHCVHPTSIIPKGAERLMPYRVTPDFILGNIFPNSVWSLNHLPACGPKALTYMKSTNSWIAIYDNHQWEELTGEKVSIFDGPKIGEDMESSGSWKEYVTGSSLIGLDAYKALWNSPNIIPNVIKEK